jgi:hypothetical protein
MNFRIRGIDTDNFAKGEKAYWLHLKPFDKSANRDLWKFFGWDFFHDGEVESIQINGSLRTVVMRLGSDNIKRLKSDGDFDPVPMMFTCTFHGVSSLTMNDEVDKRWAGLPRAECWPARFRHGEINTSPSLKSPEPKGEASSDARYSLLMELPAGDGASTVWLELVFSQVDVKPDEPAAFMLMEADPNFKVSTWSAEKDEKVARIEGSIGASVHRRKGRRR